MGAARSAVRFVLVVASAVTAASLAFAVTGAGAYAAAGMAHPGGVPQAARTARSASPVSPSFSTGWNQAPAHALLGGLSCLSATYCVAVGNYDDAAGSQVSAAQIWDGHAWRVLGGVPGSGLSDVSCLSKAFCVAVGNVTDEWTGHTWKELKEPSALAGDALSSVVCRATSFCMAVGTNSAGTSNVSALWNGHAWRKLTTPQDDCGPFCELAQVACPSRSYCQAVGASGTDDETANFPFAVTWNGTSWAEVATPQTPSISGLEDIACATAKNCVAVGWYEEEDPYCNGCVLVDGWNGSTWTQLSIPTTDGALYGVSCPEANDCVVVGGSLAMTWNGTSWQSLTIASPGDSGATLYKIACWSLSGCMAVGNYNDASGAQFTLAERWNGASWSVERTFTQGDPNAGFSAVSCRTTTDCVAVGDYVGQGDVLSALAEHWNGHSWSVLSPAEPGAQVNVLTSVSCPAIGNCVAVGYYDVSGSPQTLAEQWDGSSWRLLSTSQAGTLQAVSCTATDNCVAVGSDSAGSTRSTLSETWNGSSWQVQATPSPGATFGELAGISCPSATNCTAVGAYNTSAGSTYSPLTERWNGSSWTVQANPGGARQMAAVSCTRARCVAVGSSLFAGGPRKPTGTAGLVWNGSAWAVSRTVNSGQRIQARLSGVSCASASLCQGVGGYQASSGGTAVLAEFWNGKAWALRKVPAPSPAFDELYGISCTSGSSCIAVGVTGAQQTLAEHWNGSRWLLTKTLNP